MTSLAGPVVVDASVVVELLVGPTFAVQATALFRDVASGRITAYAPDLVHVEVMSALRRMAALRRVTDAEASHAASLARALPVALARSFPLCDAVWSLRAWLTPYDACYAALAATLHAPLVTADGKLSRALASRRRAVRHLSTL